MRLCVAVFAVDKTMSIPEPTPSRDIRYQPDCTVTKRRIVDEYKRVFVKHGYEVKILNFISSLKPEMSFDTLKYVSSYADTWFFVESVVKANPQKNPSSMNLVLKIQKDDPNHQ